MPKAVVRYSEANMARTPYTVKGSSSASSSSPTMGEEAEELVLPLGGELYVDEGVVFGLVEG
jgi:hypothetical protein